MDTLVGGAVALFVGIVLFPIDPVRLMRRHRAPLLEELALVLDEIHGALEANDHDVAADALGRARGLDALAARFVEAVDVGIETGRGSPLRRRTLTALRRNAVAAAELDLACRNVRVLARGAIRAADLRAHLPELTVEAVADLARAVRALGPALDDPARGGPAREAVLQAAGRASLGLEQTANLSATVIVGQVRSTASDLLKVLGVASEEAAPEVRAAAARARDDGQNFAAAVVDHNEDAAVAIDLPKDERRGVRRGRRGARRSRRGSAPQPAAGSAGSRSLTPCGAP